MRFFGRKTETAELLKIREASKREARMTVVTGRRRVGKTELIRHALDDGKTPFVYFLITRAPQSAVCENLQREIARAGKGKLDLLWQLINEHSQERILIFTADNQTAYQIGQRFRLPVLTHHTKIAERRSLLDAFRKGDLPVLVTSKILNEGVDVPEASVGIVVSGSGSIREHVQRLGRILRPAAGKQAVLYELISAGTSESYVSERRRHHRAYERPDSM